MVDPSLSDKAEVTCHFRDLKQHLLSYIQEYDAVVGCVAWLTDLDILRALAKKKNVAIIIQKEDFLRPDSADYSKARLRAAYAAVNKAATLSRHMFNEPLSHCSIGGGWTDPIGIRCVGHNNRARMPAYPRAHHKFLVFGTIDTDRYPNEVGDFEEVPLWAGTPCFSVRDGAVWTGSFNFTFNGTQSLENAVMIKKSTRLPGAYLREFSQVAARSEPLDWTEDWCAPEWRIGT